MCPRPSPFALNASHSSTSFVLLYSSIPCNFVALCNFYSLRRFFKRRLRKNGNPTKFPNLKLWHVIKCRNKKKCSSCAHTKNEGTTYFTILYTYNFTAILRKCLKFSYYLLTLFLPKLVSFCES